MSLIKDFFDYVINAISTVWDFFTGIVEDLILFVNYLSMAYVMAIECVLQLPTWLKIFGTITIGVSIMYLVVGRNAGRSS